MSNSNELSITHGSTVHKSLIKTLSKFSKLAETGCIEWQGCTSETGYGTVARDNHQLFVHRVAYAIFKGPIASGLVVMHRCDNKICINPSHLDLGTAEDNNHDKVRKNRQSKGETNNHKCSTQDIIDIRSSNRTQKWLANAYDISQQQVSAIQNYVYWKHIAMGAL